MEFNFDNTEEQIPDLQDYKIRLAAQMLRSSFFQNEKKEIFKMTELPNIIAPALLRSQVNNDKNKKTLFGKHVTVSKKSLATISRLISENKIDILNLETLSSIELHDYCHQLKIKVITSKVYSYITPSIALQNSFLQSNVMLLEELKNICKIYAAGQGE